MPTYRIYFFDDGGHISSPAIILDCAHDDEAKLQTQQYVDGKAIELWREGTLIVHFPKHPADAPAGQRQTLNDLGSLP